MINSDYIVYYRRRIDNNKHELIGVFPRVAFYVQLVNNILIPEEDSLSFNYYHTKIKNFKKDKIKELFPQLERLFKRVGVREDDND